MNFLGEVSYRILNSKMKKKQSNMIGLSNKIFIFFLLLSENGVGFFMYKK